MISSVNMREKICFHLVITLFLNKFLTHTLMYIPTNGFPDILKPASHEDWVKYTLTIIIIITIINASIQHV